MPRRQLSLTIDKEVLKRFRAYCENNDIVLSKRVERLMRRELGMGEE